MKKLELNEVKDIEFEMLCLLDDFCKLNNITLFLSGGTLLGAVRHKGFIPWDDDIDVMLLRHDYDRLCKLFPKEGINNNYLITPYNSINPQNTFSCLKNNLTYKIEKGSNKETWNEGIAIDIFPIDGVPKTQFEIDKFYKDQRRDFNKLIAITSTFCFKGNIFLKMIKILYSLLYKCLAFLGFISKFDLINNMDKRSKSYNIDSSDKIACTVFLHYGKREIVHKNGYLHPINVIFNNRSFFAPENFDEYLCNLYGTNYMELPPKELRFSHHEVQFYRK